MGIGAHLTCYIDEDVLHRFIEIEFGRHQWRHFRAGLVRRFRAFRRPVLHPALRLRADCRAVVGMEIPLVMRVLNRKGAEFKELCS